MDATSAMQAIENMDASTMIDAGGEIFRFKCDKGRRINGCGKNDLPCAFGYEKDKLCKLCRDCAMKKLKETENSQLFRGCFVCNAAIPIDDTTNPFCAGCRCSDTCNKRINVCQDHPERWARTVQCSFSGCEAQATKAFQVKTGSRAQDWKTGLCADHANQPCSFRPCIAPKTQREGMLQYKCSNEGCTNLYHHLCDQRELSKKCGGCAGRKTAEELIDNVGNLVGDQEEKKMRRPHLWM
jgi:hypothetical protein